MRKQLVSNIGIFTQKLKVFNRPLSLLHSKDHAPSPCASLSSSDDTQFTSTLAASEWRTQFGMAVHTRK